MYRIVLTKTATKSLSKVPQADVKRIRRKLKSLAANPFAEHLQVKRLIGRDGFRLRIGDWRVIYDIHNDTLIIMVFKIASRAKVYR